LAFAGFSGLEDLEVCFLAIFFRPDENDERAGLAGAMRYFVDLQNFPRPGSRWQARPGLLLRRASFGALTQKLVDRRTKDEASAADFDRRDPTFREQPVEGRARQVQRMGRLTNGVDEPPLASDCAL
jgi:hypothetical protein